MKLFSILAISAGATNFNESFLDVSKMESWAPITTTDFSKKSQENTLSWGFQEGETNWDDFLAHLRTRYKDLELRQYDGPERFLRKGIMKMVRLMQRKKEAMQRKGCLNVDAVMPYHVTVDDYKKCDVQGTLMTDVQVAATFYLGDDPYNTMMGPMDQRPEQCRKMFNRFELFYNNYGAYFADNYATMLSMQQQLCPGQ